LELPGYRIQHSGIHWLCEDQHLCRPGETVAFFNVGIIRTAASLDTADRFHEGERELQFALSTPLGGRLHRSAYSSFGGFFDQFELFVWNPDFAIGGIEPESSEDIDSADCQLRLLMTSGGGTSDRSRLASRAWRVEGDGRIGTLLSLGICELGGVIRGGRFHFEDFIDAVCGPVHLVHVPDEDIVPNSRLLAEQIRRTTDQRAEIARDLAASLAGGPVTPTPDDWIIAGGILRALQSTPLATHYDVLTRRGLRRTGPPDAIILSLRAEAPMILRHRRLGYVLQCHNYRIESAGPAFRAWLRANFEPIPRSITDIRADYDALVTLIREVAPECRILVHNVMSTSGYEDIQTYAMLDASTFASLANVRDKELNLMLHDLARERDIAIIDADAIAADLGGVRCFATDAVHQSGVMQAEIRAEILRILCSLGVPGFAPAKDFPPKRMPVRSGNAL
jgi:hypothetical protein